MDIEKRMMEMMEPVDKCIQLTDSHEDMLMLACAMMQRVREIFDSQIGIEGRKEMFKELIK
jgi:hypothetical protein